MSLNESRAKGEKEVMKPSLKVCDDDERQYQKHHLRRCNGLIYILINVVDKGRDSII
jgi:hypothetical protein